MLTLTRIATGMLFVPMRPYYCSGVFFLTNVFRRTANRHFSLAALLSEAVQIPENLYFEHTSARRVPVALPAVDAPRAAAPWRRRSDARGFWRPLTPVAGGGIILYLSLYI